MYELNQSHRETGERRQDEVSVPRAPHHLPPSSDAHLALTPEEREALQQREYEAFRRENPGKAHFTRQQWERTRM